MTSLKEFDAFTALTQAEARTFEQAGEAHGFAAGETLPDGLVAVILEGSVGLGVVTSGGEGTEVVRPLGRLEPGEVLGEIVLFEAEPPPLRATAESDGQALVWSPEGLKNAFRYSRTGAAKVLGAFSRSLSHKIRLANELLRAEPELAKSVGARPRELGALDMQRLRSFSVMREYPPDTILFEEGDAGGELFVIAEGEVEILKQAAPEKPMRLALLESGDFFGEMAFVDEKQRSATAVARLPLRVHVIPAGSLESIFQLNVGTGLYFTSLLCKIMSRRLDATLRRIVSA